MTDPNSIVDTLKAQGQPSDYNSRAKLYETSGLGTEAEYRALGSNNASANISLLNLINQNKSSSISSSLSGKKVYELAGNELSSVIGQPVNRQINLTPTLSNLNQINQQIDPKTGQPIQPQTYNPNDGNNGNYAPGNNPTGSNPNQGISLKEQAIKDENADTAINLVNTEFKDNIYDINKALDNAKSLNDQTYNQTLDKISGEYAYLIEKQKRLNSIEEANSQIQGFRGNTDAISSSAQAQFNDLLQTNLEEIRQLEKERDAKIKEALLNYNKGNSNETFRLVEQIKQAQKQRDAQLNTIQDNIRARENILRQQQKDALTLQKENKKILLDDFENSYDTYEEEYLKNPNKFLNKYSILNGLDPAEIRSYLNKGSIKLEKERRAINADERAQKQLDLSEKRFDLAEQRYIDDKNKDKDKDIKVKKSDVLDSIKWI